MAEQVDYRMGSTITPNSKSTSGLTPLIGAAESGHEAVVQLLLGRHDIIPGPTDRRGRTLLWCAARNGHEGVVRRLLERDDVDLNKGLPSRELLERSCTL
jgi:ankyrin repeat protein